jgi:hypothetical protein
VLGGVDPKHRHYFGCTIHSAIEKFGIEELILNGKWRQQAK